MIAIASMLQESNTFSPVPTYYDDFSPVYGEAVLERHRGKLTEMGGFLDVLDSAGVPVAPIYASWAITANRLVRPDLERLLENFRQGLRAAEPVDGLLFAMHGAQTAEGTDDVEGLFLGATREILGPDKPIIVTLDLHANITRAMAERATALVGYHTYPHIDMFETGQKAARLMLRVLAGESRPVVEVGKLPLILNAERSQTGSGPMHELIVEAERLEQSGFEAVSIFPVQPWMDIDEMGSAVVVVGNGDRDAASAEARRLARRLWDKRLEFVAELTPVEEAVRFACETPEKEWPVVLSESADSTGSGSPGDSTGLLKHLVTAPLKGPAAIFVVDPAAVARAFEAGAGARVSTPVGGSLDTMNSRPVPVDAHVKILSDGRWTARARGYNTGIETHMGRAAVLVAGRVHILVAEKSSMTVDPALFQSHGIDPAWCQIVAVKSPNGFRAAYEPIAKHLMVVDTPGVSTAKLESLPWKRVARPIYPLDPGTELPAGF